MSKIIGYKFIGIVNGLQQFVPIHEGEELTNQIITDWKEDFARKELVKQWGEAIKEGFFEEKDELPSYTIERTEVQGFPVYFMRGYINKQKIVHPLNPPYDKDKCDRIWKEVVEDVRNGTYE